MSEIRDEIAALRAAIKDMKKAVKRMEKACEPVTEIRYAVGMVDWRKMYQDTGVS